ncbi:MAG TPA: AraC family transcriptional regulator [Clostridiaceae bacterium]|nr:AraC family transcriptional regulator [Clostridiaceae bacterium]
MYENLQIRRLNHMDLNMYQCGTEACEPGHCWGPAVRDHYLIHYISSGKGIFQVNGKTYHLGKGQGFLICPNIVAYYQADYEDPWNYSWVGFHGLKAELYLKHAGLTADNPIFTYDSDDYIQKCFEQMIETKKLVKSRELRLLGLLYMFLTQLIEVNGSEKFIDGGENLKETYVRMAIEYIQRNYSRKISISDIADHVRLNRSYLGSVFKEYMNTSLQDYLVNFRINRACELMLDNNLSIGDISRSIGYDDQLLFSKIFKKVKGLPPREYRKNIRAV